MTLGPVSSPRLGLQSLERASRIDETQTKPAQALAPSTSTEPTVETRAPASLDVQAANRERARGLEDAVRRGLAPVPGEEAPRPSYLRPDGSFDVGGKGTSGGGSTASFGSKGRG
jgi:hypothetical protein